MPWRSASRPWLLGLAWLALLLAPARSQGRADGPEDFGRWQSSPRQCLLQRSSTTAANPRPERCRNVRLDQLWPGLLTLRFSEAGVNDRLGSPQLTLAGVLQPGSRIMACREGRCQPRWPLVLQVSALADRGLRPELGLSQLPLAQLARGECRFNRLGGRCRVEASDGLSWQVEVTW
ncbi:MAG: hypothetical protein WAM11_16180 [Cyanobium sp.]